MRVGHASKLLRESKLSVSEICYTSGYNNVANFNRQFKQLKFSTPLKYRKMYREGEASLLSDSERNDLIYRTDLLLNEGK